MREKESDAFEERPDNRGKKREVASKEDRFASTLRLRKTHPGLSIRLVEIIVIELIAVS